MKHQQLTEQLIGIFYDVYRELGYGFLESVYEKAYASLLKERGIAFEQQHPITILFRGAELADFRIDLLVAGLVVVELKASRVLDGIDEKQLMNYLKATNLEVGLLFNFGPTPHFRRIIFDNERKSSVATAGSP